MADVGDKLYKMAGDEILIREQSRISSADILALSSVRLTSASAILAKSCRGNAPSASIRGWRGSAIPRWKEPNRDGGHLRKLRETGLGAPKFGSLESVVASFRRLTPG